MGHSHIFNPCRKNVPDTSQESSIANSLVINTNNATKGKSDESSKIEQIGTDQTSNIEDKETDDDSIPLNKLYKCHHTRKKYKNIYKKILSYH